MSKSIIICLLLVALIPDAQAGSLDPAAITMVQLYGTPSQNFTDIYVTTCPSSGTSVSPCMTNTSCSNKGGFVLERTHPLFREMYATVLAARLSGTRVGFLGTGACSAHGLEILAEVWIPNG